MKSLSIARNLRCKLTEEDKLRIGAEAADLAKEVEDLEATLDSTRKAIKADIDAKASNRNHCLSLLRTGYEYRQVECEVNFNEPGAGKKTIVRTDTGEEVAVEVMTDAERQQNLEFEEGGEAA